MWTHHESYERFMGRWSRVLANQLVRRAMSTDAGTGQWMDVGCGPGAVIAAALEAGVGHVTGVDPSPSFVAAARERFAGQPVAIVDGDGTHLPDGPFDAVLCSLALNFMPDPTAAMTAMAAALGDQGVGVAAVWDYDDPGSFLFRAHAAIERVLGHASEGDERGAFAVCTTTGLASAAGSAGWEGSVESLVVPTPFRDVADLWDPFLGGIGPAGAWVVQQTQEVQHAVRDELVADVFADGAPAQLSMRALVVSTR